MKQSKFSIFIASILCLAFSNTKAQKNENNIFGKVQDSISSKPIEYATVTINNLKTNRPITGGITGKDGSYSIGNIPVGSYSVVIDFLGYKTFKIDSVVLTQTNKTIVIPTIKLIANQTSLQDVTVTSKTSIIDNKIDKIVYNAANDITSQGGSAIDILRKVPQVNVDIDGNVELQGNPNIRFLINGKPSSVFGNSLADALASIPASQIKSIEAITSPGAKYDAQGTGGIINIILKDIKVKGINGNISMSGGTRLQNASANLNIRHGNLGVNAFFSGNAQLSSRTPYSQDRYSYDTTNKTTSRLTQDGHSDFKRNGYRSGLGFDWNISKKDDLSGSLGYNYFGSKSISDIDQKLWQDPLSSPLIFSHRNSNNKQSIGSVDWDLAYKRKLKKDGQELDVLYSASSGLPSNEYLQSQTYPTATYPFSASSSKNIGKDIQHEVSIDYTYPINDDITIETGVKSVFQKIASNSSSQIFDTTLKGYFPSTLLSYNLHYNMQVYAGYVSATFKLFKFLDLKAGGRFEHTDVKIDFPNTSIPSYNTFVPSIILSHTLDKDRFIKLAYTRRIERPEYRELNPFVNLSDPYNITTGNPLLRPEIGNNFELGFGKSYKSGANIYIALTERINTNDLKAYTTFYPTYQAGDTTYENVSVTTRLNIGKEYNTGINISGSIPIKNLTIRGNIMTTHKRVINNLLNGTRANGVTFRVNFNASYKLPKNLIVEAFGNYNSPFNTIQGKRPQSLTYTIACRKQFWNKNASIGLTATNPFNQYVNQLTTINAANYTSNNLTKIPYRSFGISFTYKFGKLEFKKNKEESNYQSNPPSMEN